MQCEWLKHLFQKRMLIVLILGFASGLPLGLTGATLQAWYTVEHVDIVTIGLLALVGQPYVYKFLWAPLLDRSLFLSIGRRRGWMAIMQVAIMLMLIGMAQLNPGNMPGVLAVLALCLAFLSATQDIAIDAFRTEILAPAERGSGAAMAVAGYRIAMLVSGGLALVMAGLLGFQLTYMVMAGLMGVGLLATWFGTEPKVYKAPPPNFVAACVEPLKEFLSRKNALILLALVVLYKFGDAFAGSLTTAFLLRGVGFSLVDVGLMNKTVGLVATLIGVFAGGVFLSKIGLFRALLWFGLIQALANLTHILLAIFGKNYIIMVFAIFLENLGGGMGTAAYFAMLMALCDPRYTATQFALLSALSAVGRVFVGPLAGVIVNKFGWIEFFLWSLVISLPGILLLFKLKTTIYKIDKRGLQKTQEAEEIEEVEETTGSAVASSPVWRKT